jgi:putative SOS response-associated peptidase YedK
MCGRAKLTTPPEVLRELFELREVPSLGAHYNIAPTQLLAVIRRPGELEELRFGLVPPWARSVAEGNRFINARAETVAKIPAFREAFRGRRCIVVVDGFYEWQKEGKRSAPYVLRLANGDPFGLAGVWGAWHSRDGEVVESVAIVTAPSLGAAARLHDRMPIVLSPSSYGDWLDPSLPDPERLLAPARVEELVAMPVSTAVNDPRNDGPECVAPPEQTSLGALEKSTEGPAGSRENRK